MAYNFMEIANRFGDSAKLHSNATFDISTFNQMQLIELLALPEGDEAAGQNCGQIIYKNGIEIEWYYPDRTKEIAEIYKECWGMPPFEEVLCYDEIE